MTTPRSKSRLQQWVTQSTTPFVTRHFDLSAVLGISAHALEVHVDLYEGYVRETNGLLPLVYGQSESRDLSPVERLQRDGLVRRFAFERNGMVLHELFFEALHGPSAPPRSGSDFDAAVQSSYGSFSGWQDDVRKVAQTRGIGWVLTMYSAGQNRLSNVWVDDHTHGVLADCSVVCAIDLWEHAYVIDYKPAERGQYLQTVFDNIDWEVVESRCEL